MAKKIIHLMFILDETRSMNSVKTPTISGFNEYVNSLKREKSVNYKFSLISFNSISLKLVHDSVSIKEIHDLTDKTYIPDGGTPLYDAIAKGINKIYKKRNVLFVIQTDGEENSSKEFSQKDIFGMIQDKTESGWQFVFMGANQDAWEVGAQFGLKKGQTLSYDNSQTAQAFGEISKASSIYASSLNANKKMSKDFFDSQDIRKKKRNLR
jgi:hypothetical protein